MKKKIVANKKLKYYQCKYCSTSFTHKNNMYRHVNNHCIYNPNSLKVLEGINNDSLPNKQKDKQVVSQNENIVNSKNENTNPKEGHESNQNEEMIQQITQKVAEQMSKKLEEQLVKKMKEHEEKIEQLEKEHELIKVTPTTVNNSINNTINVIYVTDKLDYLEILNEKFGERSKTIEYLKNKLHSKIKGEVDVFCDIHLNGPVNTWPVQLPDKTKKHLYLTQPDNTLIPDPGGIKLHKHFYGNYQNALLRLINQQIFQVVDQGVGTEEFENLRDDLLDDFDLQAFQTRAIEVGRENPNTFIKKLMDEMIQRCP